MGIDDRAANRETHAETVGLRREQGIEDAMADGRIDARTCILDRHEHIPGFAELRGHGQHPRKFRRRTHGFDAVHNQIQKYLLQLDPISTDRRAAAVESSVKCYVVPTYFTASQRQNFLDRAVHVDLNWLWFRPSGEGSQRPDHVAGAHGGLLDAHQALPYLIEVEIVAPQPLQTGAGLYRDGGKRLLDLMGDGCGQLARRGQPRKMRE